MAAKRGGAFACAVRFRRVLRFALAAALLGAAGACTSKTGSNVVPPQPQFDGAVYQECDSVCIRPGDCAQTFNDDGICPPGFLCALRFTCTPD
jgi:hypothetical protein